MDDGFLWGRGTIDMKNMAAMELTAMLLLHRHGAKLKRDLIFAAVADEEAGCQFGSMFLADQHPELIRGEYAISETGGFTLHTGGKRFYPTRRDSLTIEPASSINSYERRQLISRSPGH